MTVMIATEGDENWVLSANGSYIFVAGNDGFLRVYSSATGELLHSVQLGINLGAIALSPDGTMLAVTEDVAANVQQFQSWTDNRADVSLYIVDLNTFGAQVYTYTVTGSDFTFADVAWSDNDTLQVSQNILPGWSGWAALSTIEVATGTRTQHGSYYTGLGSAPSLQHVPGSSSVLLGQLGLSSAEYFLIGDSGASIGNNGGSYQNNVYGYASGIEAASGSTADDRVVVITGGGAHLYDGTLNYIVDLSQYYPDLGYARGVTFSADGSRIFFLDATNQSVVVIDSHNFTVVATVELPGVNFETLRWGEEIIVSADGNGFYYNTTEGIAYSAVSLPDVGTDGPNTLYGTSGDDIIDGKGGDDTLYGLDGSDWLIGGLGNDTIDGGAGFDYAAYDTASAGVTVSLAISGAQSTGGAGTDTLINIEALSGSIYNDVLTGNGAENVILGYDGDDEIHGAGGDDDLYGENGNDLLYGDAGVDWLYGGAGNDLLDGGTGADRLEGGNGDDIYVVDNAGDVIIETATGGNDTMRVYGFNATIAASVETLIIMQGAFNATGNFVANTLIGSSESNVLTGMGGNDIIDGRGGIDTAVVSGTRAQYTVTQGATGVFTVSGPDGTDTLTNVEYLQFNDQTIRLMPGTGVTVNFETADPSVYQSAMDAILDFDGNALGGNGSWLRIGSADVDGDGDIDQILVNDAIGRFATVGTADDGMVYFHDNGWAGETRVVGIYIDPLVAAGQVVAGSAEDSQQRFQNDLNIENINRVLGADDYDGDGLQEVYFALTDGTAYIHAYMHADGNIHYANYQSQAQVIEYLTAHGYSADTWAGWFPSNSAAEEVEAMAPAPKLFDMSEWHLADMPGFGDDATPGLRIMDDWLL